MNKAYLNIQTTGKGTNNNFYAVQSPVSFENEKELFFYLKDYYIHKPVGSLQQFKGYITAYRDVSRTQPFMKVNFEYGKVKEQLIYT
jgi:hypothetical protein